MIIRPATPDDAGVVAEISTTSRHAAMPTIRWAHTAEEDRWWVAHVLLPKDEVWVAEEGGVVLGFLALHRDEDGDWVSQLYLRPGGLRLWCFHVNARGRAFYERHGFRVDRMTDGAGNKEREPDILYEWA